MNLKIMVTHDRDIISEVPYKIVNYPAGEVGFVWGGIGDYITDYGISIDIHVDLYTANDLMVLHRLLGEIRKSINYYHQYFPFVSVKLNTINIGYLGFARQDKEKCIDVDGEYMYETPMLDSAINIIIDMIGGTHCKINVLDPHATIKVLGINGLMPDILFEGIEPIFPDEGALNRYALNLYGSNDFLYAKKERGDNGNIISYDLVEYNKEFDVNKDYVVFDDICDGGATFLFLAKLLKDKGHKGKLYLQVTHGLFTKGKEELLKYYDEIKCMTEMKKD